MSDIDPNDIEALLSRIVRMSAPLHDSISRFDEVAGSYSLAAAPGVALFERDAGSTISHISSSPAPDLMMALDDLQPRHLEAAGTSDVAANSHLLALLLLVSYLVDERASERVKLREIAKRPAIIEAIDDEAGKHDPNLEPLDAALRAWVPLQRTDGEQGDAHTAILQFVFPTDRHQRYVPWEGAAGETAQVPSVPNLVPNGSARS